MVIFIVSIDPSLIEDILRKALQKLNLRDKAEYPSLFQSFPYPCKSARLTTHLTTHLTFGVVKREAGQSLESQNLNLSHLPPASPKGRGIGRDITQALFGRRKRG